MAKLCKLINEEGIELLPKTSTEQVDGLDTELARVKTINGIPMRGNSGITIDDKYAGLRGKYVSFLGDSITTFSGYNPDGYATYYPNTSANLSDVHQTWWKRFIDITGMKLCVNASWSGSKVTGSNSANTESAYMACSTRRVNDLANGALEADVIIVMIGINDFGANVPIGNWKGGELPAEGEITTFSEAYALMVNKILNRYPFADVFVCTLPETSCDYDENDTGVFPASFTDADGNVVTLYDYNETIRMVAKAMGVNLIDMHAAGISYGRIGTYLVDQLHPKLFGAVIMGRKAAADVVAQSIFTSDLEYTVTDGTWYVNPGWRWGCYISQPRESGFSYSDEGTQAKIRNVPINALKFAVATEGTFTYGKVDASGNMTKLGTIELTNPSTIPQVFVLNETITLGDNENLWFNGSTVDGEVDDGKFYFGPAEKNVTDYYFGLSLNLGIGIGYIDNA